MQNKITACSSTYEVKETTDLEKSVASDLDQKDRPIKDLLDERTKEDDATK